jgi:hypothetical protein
MIPLLDYQAYIFNIGRKFKNPAIDWVQWHNSYIFYENEWEKYFTRVFIPNHVKERCVKIELWESCPGGMPYPHPNYAFGDYKHRCRLDGSLDTYLKKMADKHGVVWSERTILQVLEDLARNNVLILDVYPTHGISLDTSNRVKLFATVFPTYTIGKFRSIRMALTGPVCNSIGVTSELHNAGINNGMDEDLKSIIVDSLGLTEIVRIE